MSDVTYDYSVANAEFTDGTALSGSWTVEYDPTGAIVAITGVDVTLTGPAGTTTFTGLGTLPYANPAVSPDGSKDYYDVHNFGGQSSSDYQSLYLDWTSMTPSNLAKQNDDGNLYTSMSYGGNTYMLVAKAPLVSTLAPCFCADTAIATPRGDVAVQNLQVGDVVLAMNGGTATICWVGSYRQALRNADPARVLPVRICAGALADNVPQRDLFVSPDHALFIDDALVPAGLLLNGRTITQPQRSGAVRYYHVELEQHDVIFAEGAAAESFLNLGNRRQFLQGQSVVPLWDQEDKTWEDACAPLILAGPALDGIRAVLEQRAERLDAGLPREQLARVA